MALAQPGPQVPDSQTQGSQLADSPAGYGLVSRALHWSMAALFFWQFTGATLRVFAEDTPVESIFWATHYSVGFLLLVMVLVRGVWGLGNLSRRPRHEGPAALAKAASLGHALLYALMVAVPLLAVLRAAGGGRGLSVFGIELIAPGGERIPFLVEPGNALHGLLGWALLAMVVGHVVMALYHGLARRDGTLERMTRGSAA